MSAPVSDAVHPNDVYINTTQDLDACKYLGVVETKAGKDWKTSIRSAAGEMGATHVQTSGPNNVTGSFEGETIRGNAYKCKIANS